jgi:tRNA A37 methylthiotransferase MiaB
MTVQELLDELNKVADKSTTVIVAGCYASDGDIQNVSISEAGEIPEHPNETVVTLYTDLCNGIM